MAGIGAQFWLTNRDGVFVEGAWIDLKNSDPTLFHDDTRVSASPGWIEQTGRHPDPQFGLGYRSTRNLSLWGSSADEDRDSLHQFSHITNI